MDYKKLSLIGLASLVTALLVLPLVLVSPLLGTVWVLKEDLEGPTCGDGIVNESEMCDDGNQVIYDGCTGCMVERQYRCTGQPSACMRSVVTEDSSSSKDLETDIPVPTWLVLPVTD